MVTSAGHIPTDANRHPTALAEYRKFRKLTKVAAERARTQGSYNIHSYSGDFGRLMVGM